jgi:hypothetical protein
MFSHDFYLQHLASDRIASMQAEAARDRLAEQAKAAGTAKDAEDAQASSPFHSLRTALSPGRHLSTIRLVKM